MIEVVEVRVRVCYLRLLWPVLLPPRDEEPPPKLLRDEEPPPKLLRDEEPLPKLLRDEELLL
jgi:hypothetical protein